jgi:hypothetical protein
MAGRIPSATAFAQRLLRSIEPANAVGGPMRPDENERRSLADLVDALQTRRRRGVRKLSRMPQGDNPYSPPVDSIEESMRRNDHLPVREFRELRCS